LSLVSRTPVWQGSLSNRVEAGAIIGGESLQHPYRGRRAAVERPSSARLCDDGTPLDQPQAHEPPTNASKRGAARAALGEVPHEGIVGLGTGSTACLFVEELAPLVYPNAPDGRRVVGVATSEATRALATRLGIPLLDDDGPWRIDVTVDGADEVSDALDLIKGGGGAHAREKIINYASKRNVIVVDESKLSAQLGTKFAVPVEVLPFAHRVTAAHLAELGTPALRMRGEHPFRTDAGNLVYDLSVTPIVDPSSLDHAIREIPGVVETGIFVRRADLVIVAGAGGVRRLERAK
jgi:ribose 5-phosphate isomerase A